MADAKARFTLSARDQTKRVFGNVRRGLGGLRRVSNDVGASIARTGRTLATFATLGGLGAIVGLSRGISGAAEEMDGLGKLATRLRVPTEFLSLMEFVSGRSGLDPGRFSKGLEQMVVRVGEASLGLGEARGIIHAMGFDARLLSRMRPDRQFAVLVQGLGKIRNTGQRQFGFAKIFGEEQKQMSQLLDSGVKGLVATIREGRRLGAERTGRQSGLSAMFNDEAMNLQTVLKSMGDAFYTGLMPRITGAMKLATNALVTFRQDGLEAGFRYLRKESPAVASGLAKLVLLSFDLYDGFKLGLEKVRGMASVLTSNRLLKGARLLSAATGLGQAGREMVFAQVGGLGAIGSGLRDGGLGGMQRAARQANLETGIRSMEFREALMEMGRAAGILDDPTDAAGNPTRPVHDQKTVQVLTQMLEVMKRQEQFGVAAP